MRLVSDVEGSSACVWVGGVGEWGRVCWYRYHGRETEVVFLLKFSSDWIIFLGQIKSRSWNMRIKIDETTLKMRKDEKIQWRPKERKREKRFEIIFHEIPEPRMQQGCQEMWRNKELDLTRVTVLSDWPYHRDEKLYCFYLFFQQNLPGRTLWIT